MFHPSNWHPHGLPRWHHGIGLIGGARSGVHESTWIPQKKLLLCRRSPGEPSGARLDQAAPPPDATFGTGLGAPRRP